jgi:hypothetical protein
MQRGTRKSAPADSALLAQGVHFPVREHRPVFHPLYASGKRMLGQSAADAALLLGVANRFAGLSTLSPLPRFGPKGGSGA